MKFQFLILIFYLEAIISEAPTIELTDNIPRNGNIAASPTTSSTITTENAITTTEQLPTTTQNSQTESSQTTSVDESSTVVTTDSPTDAATETSEQSTITDLPSTPVSTDSVASTTLAPSESPESTTESATTTTTPTTSTPTTTTTLPTTTSLPTLRLSDDNPYLPWDPIIDGNFEVIETELGYKIRVELIFCILDSKNGDFVKISGSEAFDSVDTLFITYTADNFKPFLFNTNILYATFSGTEASNFTANFSRIGEKLTTVTTEEPSSTIILPTPSSNDSYELTVFLGGRTADDYKEADLQKSLKEMITGMATEYCKTENFKLSEPITTNNIILEQIVQCSVNWPDYKNCISLTFSVPIELEEDPKGAWQGYQLTSQHLQIMWDMYAKKYLTDGLYIYNPPDSTSWLKVQLILFSSVTVIFVVCLIVIRQISLKISKAMIRRRMSDTASIISSERPSELSLPPHYLQETPPLFDNTYMMYNPKNDKGYEPSLSENFGYNYGYPNFSDLSKGTQNGEDDDWDSDTSQILESGA